MTDKKIDLSSLSNFDLGPNWETTPVKGNKEFKQTKKKRKSYLKTNDKRAIAKPIFDINITYDHSVISKIKDKIRKSGITYSVEEIANTIISTKERLSFKVEKQNKETFFEVIFDNSIFSSRDKAINHVIQNGLDSLVKVTSIEEESTTGKYDSILKCPISKKLLPPKNYHNFESCVYQHLYENKIVRKYEDFVNNLENITEPEVIESWKKTPIKKFTYQFKNKLGKEKKFESINLITKEIENSFVNFVREKNKIVISGIEIDKLDKLLMNEIKEFFYSSEASASRGESYSSSFAPAEFQSVAYESKLFRLFYKQELLTKNNTIDGKEPVEITITSPTKLVTQEPGDSKLKVD